MSLSDVLTGNRTWWVECANALEGLKKLPDESVQMCVCSPPYFALRNYNTEPQVWGGDRDCDHEWQEFIKPGNTWGVPNKNVPGLIHKNPETNTSLVGAREQAVCAKCGAWRGELGSETIHDCSGWATGNRCGNCFVCNTTNIFREVWRVLRDDGVLWLNIGDSYAQSGGSGSGEYQKRHKQFGKVIEQGTAQAPRSAPPGLKPKDLCGVPWRLALSLQSEGWYLRNDIVWNKNAMPESPTDRCSRDHEYVFLFSKSQNYYFDQEAIRMPYHPDSTKRKQYPTNKMGGYLEEGKVRGGKGAQGGGVTGMVKQNHSGANKRTVWRITNEVSNWDFCMKCERLYMGVERKAIKIVPAEDEDKPATRFCKCGASDAWVGHFATFPTELPSTCVKAGSSHKACEHCGAPWKRIIEPSEEYAKLLGKGFHDHSHDETQGMRQKKQVPSVSAQYVTVGWEPTCNCENNKGLTSSIVLDPFNGSGRTGIATLRLGRRYIGIDLKPDYVKLARAIIANDMPLLNMFNQGGMNDEVSSIGK